MDFLYALPEDIREGRTTDVYFERTVRVLKAKGLADVEVYAEVTASSMPRGYKWAVYAGLREVAKLLRGKAVNLYSMPEGTIFKPLDYRGVKIPLMVLEGPYGEFAIYETALLGFLAAASGITTKAARVKKAASGRPVLSFGARRTHPAIAPFVDYYAYLGGCDGVSCIKGAELLGIKPSGTMPHSLMIVFRAVKGDHTQAWLAFDEVLEPEIPRIALVDTFWDEAEEAVRAAELLDGRLWGVRLDTPGSRRGDMAEIVREVRWKLRASGYNNVKIVVSGGLNEYSIPELVEAGADAFGVGSAIANAPFIDYAMDITAVKVNGEWKPLSKRGKFSGRKQVYRCWNCMIDLVELEEKKQPHCPNCKSPMSPLLELVVEGGKLKKEIEPPQKVRERILEQTSKVDLL
mgnify:CR=1 FL=1